MAAALGSSGYVCGIIGLKKVHAGIASVVYNVEGPLITLFGAIVTRVIPRLMTSIGLAVSCVGLILVGAPHFKSKSLMLGLTFLA